MTSSVRQVVPPDAWGKFPDALPRLKLPDGATEWHQILAKDVAAAFQGEPLV